MNIGNEFETMYKGAFSTESDDFSKRYVIFKVKVEKSSAIKSHIPRVISFFIIQEDLAHRGCCGGEVCRDERNRDVRVSF